uniref:Uncharacterized protein n=1 Tax=Aegilops tauschii subsp. strangulata TaxID=200361 RepID=A0A453FQQ2_AEGTS
PPVPSGRETNGGTRTQTASPPPAPRSPPRGLVALAAQSAHRLPQQPARSSARRSGLPDRLRPSLPRFRRAGAARPIDRSPRAEGASPRAPGVVSRAEGGKLPAWRAGRPGSPAVRPWRRGGPATGTGTGRGRRPRPAGTGGRRAPRLT